MRLLISNISQVEVVQVGFRVRHLRCMILVCECVWFLDFCLFGLFFLPILNVQQATSISLLFKTGSLFNEIPP